MLDWLEKELAKQQKKVQESERALAEYRDKQNAMSLDDKQNIVLSRLNKLNDARDRRRKMERMQKEAQYNQIKPMMRAASAGGLARHDSRRRAERRRCSRSRQARRAAAAEGAALGEVRREAPGHPEGERRSSADAQRQLELETSKALQSIKNDYDTAVLEERTLAPEPRGGEGRRPGPEPEERRLQRHGARGEEQPAGLRVAAAARERAARVEQQPREQRPRRRSRRGAEGADHADRPPDLAAVARRRPRAGDRASPTASTT